MDDRDLALVARLRSEPTPDDDVVTRHRHQLQAAIRATANGSVDGDLPAATDPPTTDAAPASSIATAADAESPSTGQPGQPNQSNPHGVQPTRRRAGRAGRGGGRSWRRGVVAAAAAVVVLGGVLAAVGLVSNDDRTETGAQPQPGPPVEAPCGTELPFPFPAPPGYEGPFPGPSESENIIEETQRTLPSDAARDTVQTHWRSAEGTIDVRWPSYPPMDPTTLWGLEATRLSETSWPGHQGRASWLRVATTAIGAGQCEEIEIVATSDDPAVVESTIDQIALALAGPGGILPSPATGALVSESIEADALPEVDCEPVGTTVDDMGTYPTPTEALAAFLVTEPQLPQWYYQEVALPDGSLGYVFYNLDISRAGDPTIDPRRPPTTDDVIAVVHVVPRGDGWSAGSWQSCG
jgi:hypothetical protein